MNATATTLRTNLATHTLPLEVVLNPNPTVQVLLRAMPIALNRDGWDLLDEDEVEGIIGCLEAGLWDSEGLDCAICVLEDAMEQIGFDAMVALDSLRSISPC
jgi:hypothetical protein